MLDEDSYAPANPTMSGCRRFLVLTGCSGGGKSTLLGELARRGYQVRPEAGRQVVREQLHLGGDGLPWQDAIKFVELAASRTMYLFNTTEAGEGTVFFDRSLVDLVSFLEMKGLPVPEHLRRSLDLYRYARTVFVTPPWREIYVNEAERSKSFEDACCEYDALVAAYAASGYELIELPKLAVAERADFVVARLSL